MVVKVDVCGQELWEVVTAEAAAGKDAQIGPGQVAVAAQLVDAFEGSGGAAGSEEVAAAGFDQGLKGFFGLLELVEGAVEGPGVLVGGLGQLFEGKLVEAVVGQQGTKHKTVGPGALEIADLLLHALDLSVGVHKIAGAAADHDKYGLCYLFSKEVEALHGGGNAAMGIVGAVFEAVGCAASGLQQGLW